jgi:hypothetical protein
VNRGIGSSLDHSIIPVSFPFATLERDLRSNMRFTPLEISATALLYSISEHILELEIAADPKV